MSRQRYEMLSNCIDSVYKKARFPDKIETLVLYDSDDEPTLDIIQNKVHQYGSQIKYECKIVTQDDRKNKKLNLNRDYNNYGALKSEGQYVWGIGNDTVIATQNWDDIVAFEIERFVGQHGDRLCFAFVNDDCPSTMKEHYRKVCSFPILTRESIEVMGGIFPNEITGHTADFYIADIYEKLKENRTLDLFDKVYIEHICHYNNKTSQDEVNRNMFGYMDHVSHLTEEELTNYINKFNKVIDDGKPLRFL